MKQTVIQVIISLGNGLSAMQYQDINSSPPNAAYTCR